MPETVPPTESDPITVTAAGNTVLIQRWLGTKPFVLIELDAIKGANFDQDDNDYTLTMDMTFGGGIGRSGAFGVLAEMLEQNGWQTTPPDGFDPDAED